MKNRLCRYDTRQDRRDPICQLHLPNGRRADDDPPLAYQPITGYPRMPGDESMRPEPRHRELSLVQVSER